MSREYFTIHLHLKSKKKRALFDRFVIAAAIIYPLSTTPQIIRVFEGQTEGISLLTWVFYVFFSSFFLTYGLMHKVKPMIYGNSLWIIVNSLVILGVVLHRYH